MVGSPTDMAQKQRRQAEDDRSKHFRLHDLDELLRSITGKTNAFHSHRLSPYVWSSTSNGRFVSMATAPLGSIRLPHSSFALRSAALTFTGDPFFESPEDCVVYESDALLVVENGVLTGFGPASVLLTDLPADVPVT